MTIDSDPAKLAETLVRRYWALMATNQFERTAEVLSADVTLDFPQTNERIRGAANLARFNQEYPAHGRWTFEIRRLIASAGEAVSQVAVSDGVQGGEPITFFRIRDGLIAGMIEYWPENAEPATTRKHLTEPLTGSWPDPSTESQT